jgi:phosphatidylserine/phosphatidylglycerophosphate/cardiolipin synthase-like enzyme
MKASRVLVAIPALCIASCMGVQLGGTFPGLTDGSNDVDFAQLSRYFEDRTGGLIVAAVPESTYTARRIRFHWDPYNTLRIHAANQFVADSVQALFKLNTTRFVAEQAAPDFITAVLRYTAQLPFDNRKQAHVHPYRSLAMWGSLGYPPIRSLEAPLTFYNRAYASLDQTAISGSRYFDPAFQSALDEETQTELTCGNTLRALFNGNQSWPEKLRFAREARRQLYVAVMTLVADETGKELIRIMVERKHAGVDVRLITDDFYTFSISEYAVGVLEREGIPVARVADKRLNQIDRMFHDKFWIKDGEEAILGGMNVLDYENESDGFNFMNRDTDVLIKGPAVTSLLGNFISLWKRYDRRGVSIASAESTYVHDCAAQHAAGVRGKEHYARWLNDPHSRMDGICRTAVQGDDADTQKIATLLLRYLNAAKESFAITSPEAEFDLESLSPATNDSLARLLREKIRTPGFSATYITNGPDGGTGESTIFLRYRVHDARLVGDPLWADIMVPLIDQAGRDVSRNVRHVLGPLVDEGLHAYQYVNYIHAKQFMFDRLLVGIGSWNFDVYSAENNHECAIFCLDENLRQQVERQFVLDIVNAVPILPERQLIRSNHQQADE